MEKETWLSLKKSESCSVTPQLFDTMDCSPPHAPLST